MSAADLLPVLSGLAVVAAAAAFALWPLLNRAPSGPGAGEWPVASPTRFDLYRQVLDLEFEVQTGKLSPEDFAHLRADLLARAAADLRVGQTLEDTIDTEVEREIALARQALGGERPAPPRSEVVAR